MEKVLKLYTYNGDGVASTPFPNEEEQVVITDFQYEANRMGGASQITATIMHRLCLDDLWTDNVYAEFNGEKFFVLNTPSSNKDNEDARYEHEITLLSEREVLNHVYFIDAVQYDPSVDVYKSNSTKVMFMGDINEFVARLNSSLAYSNLGYKAVVDEGIVTEPKLVSFEDKYILEALQEIFSIYEIPYYFSGKTIHVGYTENAIPNVFRYGFDDALLSISKDNANYEVVRRCTGIGSSENLPYYYPNETDDRDAIEAQGKKWIIPSSNLMPPVYRETNGAERFYNAENNKYPSPEGGYYTFENLYSEKNPNEKIVSFEDIKPTIVGMTNASGQRMDAFLEFAFDENDNDEVDDEGNYVHPYFFAKLPKYDGENGFNLFEQESEQGNMTISMTSGVCGACSFEIGVGEETNKNIVQVDDDGNLKRDKDGNVVHIDSVPQDRQNDTQNYEVWIALKKDDSTYTQIMPNKSLNLRPSAGDTFVILNINLPQGYITAAEKKLEDSIIKYMFLNNKERFTFSVNFSRIFFTENPDVLSMLNENSRILIEYNGKQHTLYVSSFTYKMSSDSPLPEISVDLTDELSVGQNSLQNALDAVKNDILSSIGGGDFLKQGLKYFLRKDIADTANGKITFRKGAEFGRYFSGLLGSGGSIFIDENNNSHAEFDYVTIRKVATFFSIVVQEMKHVGGAFIVSPSGMTCAKVEETDTAYRCYFNTKDGDKTITNQFTVGQLARRQTFNLENQAYYWRAVTAVGDDYIDLSKTDCDEGSTIPQVGDEIVGLGHKTDKTMQSAIIISAYGTDAPSIKYYQGIDSYNLEDKVIKQDYYDAESGKYKSVTYGDSYIGSKDGDTYVKYDQENGVEVKGKVSIESGSTGWNNLDGLESVINTVSDAASSAQKDAESAKTDAENAYQEASEAKGRLDEWAKDSVISPTEKQALKQEMANLQSEYQTNIKNAEKYGIDTTEYTDAWDAYKKELEYHSADTPENIEISDTFATSQSEFYSSRESLLVSIAQAAKEYADSIVSQISVGAENLLLNTGFTGDYSVANLAYSTSLEERTFLYSERLEHWNGEGEVSEDSESASGYSCEIGSISQQIKLVTGENYVISYKAKGTSLTSSIGNETFTETLTSEYQTFHHKFEYISGNLFVISGKATVCEIKLERGTIPTDWCPSRKDRNEVADMFKKYWYLQDAMKGSTDIIGGLILSSMIQLGKWTDGVMEKVDAGVSGIYNDDTDVAFWAGGTFEQAIATVQKLIGGENPSDDDWESLAKFVATHGGDIFLRGYIYALGGVFRGKIYADGGEFNNVTVSDITSKNGAFAIDKEGNATIRNVNAIGGYFSDITVNGLTAVNVDVTGNITATSGSIDNVTVSSITSKNGTFAIDEEGNTSITNLTANSGTFTNISVDGMTAVNVNVSGEINATSGSIKNVTVREINSSTDNFYIDADGNVSVKNMTANGGTFTNIVANGITAEQANISGKINATSGTFSGTVYAEDGEFNGMIKIAGGKILLNKDGSGSLANGSLYWDEQGNLTQNSDFEVSADGYTLKIEKEFADFRIYDSKGRMVVAIQPFSDIYGSTPVIYLDVPDYDMNARIDVTGITFNYGKKQAFLGTDGISFSNENGEVMKGKTEELYLYSSSDGMLKTYAKFVNGIYIGTEVKS